MSSADQPYPTLYRAGARSKQQAASIRRFTDLICWQKGHELVLRVYSETGSFPSDEKFAPTSQMRRAAVSITSNVAEGFSRHSLADKKHFYTMAQGSLTELQNQLLIARDLQYLKRKNFSELAQLAVLDHKLLTGLIKSTDGTHAS